MNKSFCPISGPTRRPISLTAIFLTLMLAFCLIGLTACGNSQNSGQTEKRVVEFSQLYNQEDSRFSLDGYTPGMTRSQIQESDGFLQNEPILFHGLPGKATYGFEGQETTGNSENSASDRLCRVTYEIEVGQMSHVEWNETATEIYKGLQAEFIKYEQLLTWQDETLQTVNEISGIWYSNNDGQMSMLSFIATPPNAEDTSFEDGSGNSPNSMSPSISITITVDLARFGPVFELYLSHFPPADDALVAVAEYVPGIFVDLMYAGDDNFTGETIYDFQNAYLRYGTVKKLVAAQKKLNQQGYSLKICDAFRPVSAQFKLWEILPDPDFVADPYHGYSTHSCGNTVDLDLVAIDGSSVEMPTPVDTFSPLADRDYSDVSREAERHALILQNAMVDSGFKISFTEWWHYYDRVSYPVAEDFEPTK